jgi:hypothetical protein
VTEYRSTDGSCGPHCRLHVKSPRVAVASERNLAGGRHRLDARKRAKLRHHLVGLQHHRFVFPVRLADHRDLHRQHVVRVESGVDGEQAADAFDHQSGADEQYHRHRDIGGYEQPAGDRRRGVRRLAAVAVQRGLQIEARGANRRNQAEDECGGDGQHQREAHDAPVERGAGQSRHRRRRHLDQGRHRERAEADTKNGAAAGHERAFDEQLTHDPASARAERRPKRQVVFAAGEPRQHQIRHIGAGDQQNEGDRAHQDAERRADFAGQHLGNRHDRHRIRRIVCWKLTPQL